jgi:hypothetical protein
MYTRALKRRSDLSVSSTPNSGSRFTSDIRKNDGMVRSPMIGATSECDRGNCLTPTFFLVLSEAKEDNAVVYLQASIRLKPGKLQDFVAMLNELAPVLAKRGMKLLGSYSNLVGRLNTVVDFWELPDANALQAALSDPELQKVAPRISDIIEDETQVLLTKLPIG